MVTGGAGFIGSHLADAFLARGDDVTAVDDFSTGRPARLGDRVALHKLSVTDARQLSQVVESDRPDLICHLAAQNNRFILRTQDAGKQQHKTKDDYERAALGGITKLHPIIPLR